MRTLSRIFLILTVVLSFSIDAYAFNQFDDACLAELLLKSEQNKTSGVIWIWSPRMNLSVYGLTEIKPVAALLDLELTVLVDPNHAELTVYEPAYVSLLSSSKVMKSKILESQGALLHFPVLIIYKNGKILLPNRPGYDEPERLYRYLYGRLL